MLSRDRLSDNCHRANPYIEQRASTGFDMDPLGDNSPLWGATQLNYPEFARQSQWPDSSDPHHQQVMQSDGYNSYPVAPIEGSYIELRTSPEIVEADSTIAENGGVIYHDYQQLPAGPSAADMFPVPTEIGSYPPAEEGGSSKNMSPDGGYSSPGPEYYASYQMVPQAYSGASPYQNVESPPESETVKYEVLEVKEEPEVYRSDPYAMGYPQPSNVNQVQKYNANNKPVIHGNILIKPANNPEPSQQYDQFEILHLHNPMNYPVQAYAQVEPNVQQHIPQEPIKIEVKINAPPQPQPQLKAQTKQRKPRRSRPYPNVSYNQQPSASIDLDPPAPTPKYRVLHANPPVPSYSKPQEEESEENCARRSARPSVIECSDYKCKKCGTFFARQCGLTQHQKWIHAERKFQCERCGKKFPSQEDLTKHIKRHDMKDKPFKCPICPKQFCHKNDLRRHMYRHEESTPYVCDSCPKCFIRKDHLLAHQLSHDRREKRSHDKENGSPM